ncbi:MAG: MHS family MFS transporter [Saprospiraceae bacterium]|nr:MHS family MFS transporter [Saprospiraceae bacterium]
MSVAAPSSLRQVIAASSAGTMIEWYDFYIFGSLAPIIATQFFPQNNPTAALLSTLATFAAGFVVRPFGALFFGRLGDMVGRKYTFMMTLMLMGGATFLIGCVPSFTQIGFWAPLIVFTLRLLQGLALGGEYGGAATYVAEHSPDGKRGYWTSWIQTTATLGLFLSLIVIMLTKISMTEEAFSDWGWRIPFWLSILMVGISYLIRRNMSESPSFATIKKEGTISRNPIKESFGHRLNFKYVLLALLGATMGQGVIWYTGHYYAMHFLKNDCRVESFMVEEIMTVAFVAGTPFFVVFGWLSDTWGRKKIMLTGMAIAALSYFPIYKTMYSVATNAHRTELTEKTTIQQSGVREEGIAGDSVIMTVTHREFTDGTSYDEKVTTRIHADGTSAQPVIKASNHLNSKDFWMLVGLIFIQVLFVTMVYGPIAAFLVEMFPVRIRYTSMSLPYHIGNGVFGGLMPAVAAYLTMNAKGSGEVPLQVDWYVQGLWYPVIIASVCFVIGFLYIDGTDHRMDD